MKKLYAIFDFETKMIISGIIMSENEALIRRDYLGLCKSGKIPYSEKTSLVCVGQLDDSLAIPGCVPSEVYIVENGILPEVGILSSNIGANDE